MRLRPSMHKFENSKAEEADIEIAQAFEAPMAAYFNKYAFPHSFSVLILNLSSEFKAITVTIEKISPRQQTMKYFKAQAFTSDLESHSGQLTSILQDYSVGLPHSLTQIVISLLKIGSHSDCKESLFVTARTSLIVFYRNILKYTSVKVI